MGGEARGYRWPSAWPGNDLAVKHGAHSPGRVQPLAEALVAELMQTAPWVTRPAYRAQLLAWSRAEAQAALVADWLDEHGLLDEQGRPRPATALADRLEARAARLRHELGLTPQALGRLLLTTAAVHRAEGGQADTLAALLTEGRAALAAGRERELQAGD